MDRTGFSGLVFTGLIRLGRGFPQVIPFLHNTVQNIHYQPHQRVDRSDRVIAITMMDVASVKNSRVSLQKLAQLGYNGTLVEVMLNRADSKVYLQPEAVEQAIGLPITYRLPSDQQIPRSVNKGVPVVMEAPRSQPAKVLQSAARAIITAHEGVPSNVA